MHHNFNCYQGAPNRCTLIAVESAVHQGKERHGHLRCDAPTRCTRTTKFGNESVSDDYGADENWWSNLEMGGGFGWGMRLSGFGASKKRRLSASQQGGGVNGLPLNPLVETKKLCKIILKLPCVGSIILWLRGFFIQHHLL
jgi:hypothetical protein